MNKYALIALMLMLALSTAMRTKTTTEPAIYEEDCTPEPGADAEGWYNSTYEWDSTTCTDRWRNSCDWTSGEYENSCTTHDENGEVIGHDWSHSSWHSDEQGNYQGTSEYSSEYEGYTNSGGCTDESFYDETTNSGSGHSHCWGYDSEGYHWSNSNEWSWDETHDWNRSCWTDEDGNENCEECIGWTDDEGEWQNECTYDEHHGEPAYHGYGCEEHEDHYNEEDEAWANLANSVAIVGDLAMQCECYVDDDGESQWGNEDAYDWDGVSHSCHTVCSVERYLVHPVEILGFLGNHTAVY